MDSFRHILGLRGMSADAITAILDRADALKPRITDKTKRGNELKGVSVVTLFYENSTRTIMSFLMAGGYMGAIMNDMSVSTSSVNKGESLFDTGKNLEAMGIDIIVIRHQQTGAPHFLAKALDAGTGIISGGDGSNEHPTQALLDLMTIREHFGFVKGLKVAIIGDITHSRVAKSNMFGLTTLGASVALAGPSTMVNAGFAKLCPNVTVTTDIKAAVKDADVVMGLRVQLERQKMSPFPDLREYSSLYAITPEILKLAKPGAMLMHPGPVNRGVEMCNPLMDSDRSYILTQAQNGVAIRMALLDLVAKARR